MTKIALHGFNNLTKSLCFSLYKLHYLNDKQSHSDYNAYINDHFSADNLTYLLTKICRSIGGNVLNIAKQDYQPQGASVTLMISEEAQPESLVAHIDKSHLCIHTYPEESPQDGLAIFRVDIELSTCGVISPLKVLNYVISEFDADVIDIDYRIRGMTRAKNGIKQYIIDGINKISDYLSLEVKNKFLVTEYNFPNQNLFHSKLSKKEIDLTKYLFQISVNDLTEQEQLSVKARLKHEIQDLYQNT